MNPPRSMESRNLQKQNFQKRIKKARMSIQRRRSKSAVAIITSLLLLSLALSQVSSVCFDSNNETIDGCVCHESCATCGRTPNPVYDADCITCADGSAVKPQWHSDFTGLCGKEKSDQVACLDEQFSLEQCRRQLRQGECTGCELELDNEGTDFCLPHQRQICSFGECCSSCETFAFAYSSCLAGIPQENEFLFVRSPDPSCSFQECQSMSPVPVPFASPITTSPPTKFPSLSTTAVQENPGGLIVGILGILLVLIVVLFVILRMRRGKASKPRNQSSSPVDPPPGSQALPADPENPTDSQSLRRYKFSGLSFKDPARSVVEEVVPKPYEQETMELPPFAMVTPVLPPIDENTEQEILYAPVSQEHTRSLAELVDAHVTRNRVRLPRRVTKISVDL